MPDQADQNLLKLLLLLLYAGGTYAQQAAALATPLDILVATPQKLLQHAEKGNVYYGDVQYVVLDEADTMFDRGFGPEVEKLLGPLRSKPQPAQCILVAATLTKVSYFTWLPGCCRYQVKIIMYSLLLVLSVFSFLLLLTGVVS